MRSLHEALWTMCRKLPTDFTPWGKRDRDTDEPWQDCSCGCRHFLPLLGQLGFDWGVCANPKSPRAGLLTFEHQGCPQFEGEDVLEGPSPLEASEAKSPDAQSSVSASPHRKLTIDFGDFQLALEHSDSISGDEVGHFLDTETGEILVLCRDYDDYEELSQRLDAGLGERYRRIEKLEPHESFRIMEDFVASVSNARFKTMLQEALSRNKPFRRFKDIVHSDRGLRDQWFAFRDDAHADHAWEWLKAHGLEAELLRIQKQGDD